MQMDRDAGRSNTSFNENFQQRVTLVEVLGVLRVSILQ